MSAARSVGQQVVELVALPFGELVAEIEKLNHVEGEVLTSPIG